MKKYITIKNNPNIIKVGSVESVVFCNKIILFLFIVIYISFNC